MNVSDLLASLTEENLRYWLETYREFGPLPGVLLTFAKSFIPPLPTALIVGVNAAVYGLWRGFLYSWIGMVAGCVVTFLIVRSIAGHPFFDRWVTKPKVNRSMVWVRRNAFSYVFLLSIFPVGPFVLVNMAAAVAQMKLRSYLIAIAAGKGIMVLSVSIIGHDVMRFVRNPAELLYVVLFLVLSFWACKKLEAKFTSEKDTRESEQAP